MIRIVGPKTPKGSWASGSPGFVNTTSRSNVPWQRTLSPFYLGPVPLYAEAPLPAARNVENAWQYSKVYLEHLDAQGNPSDDYFAWACEGWANPRAVRYPMGKGAVPEYSWWEDKRLGYLEARKCIYAPIYARAVLRTRGFLQLRDLYRQLGSLTLWDFDGYDYQELGMTLKDVINDPTRKMGHAFVLAMLLEELKEQGKL